MKVLKIILQNQSQKWYSNTMCVIIILAWNLTMTNDMKNQHCHSTARTWMCSARPRKRRENILLVYIYMSTLKAAISLFGRMCLFFSLPALPSKCHFQLYRITLYERTHISIFLNLNFFKCITSSKLQIMRKVQRQYIYEILRNILNVSVSIYLKIRK